MHVSSASELCCSVDWIGIEADKEDKARRMEIRVSASRSSARALACTRAPDLPLRLRCRYLSKCNVSGGEVWMRNIYRNGYVSGLRSRAAGKRGRRPIKIKGVTWSNQRIPPVSRRSRELGMDSCNDRRLDELMVYPDPGSLRGHRNRLAAIPENASHPSKYKFGAV